VAKLLWVSLLLAAAAGQAAEPPQVKFSLAVRAGDAAPVVMVAATVPPGTQHRLQATEHLTFDIDVPAVEDGMVFTTVKLLDDSSGTPVEVAKSLWRGPTTEERSFAYTVCPGRTIFLRPATSPVASCANLPPMAKPDPIVGGACGDCAGPYEGMPATFSSVSRIAPAGEPGDPLVVTGRVLGPDGKPRRGVIVYAYHTNAQGIYPPPDPPRSLFSNHHGRLRGWVKTDARGRFTFQTIRPANYPNTTIAQHIHMHVIEPGCATYYIDETLFTDDPMFQRMSPETVAREGPGRGGKGITTPHRDASGAWHIERDIHLGQNIPGYPGCSP
jgi:protocatechuate 3,4-dioxygenase beta subunit